MSSDKYRLNHNPSAEYNPPTGFGTNFDESAIVTKIAYISYRVNTATDDLERRVDSGPWVPLSENVSKLLFTYELEDGTLTREPAQWGDIRTVHVNMEARTEERDLMVAERRQIHYSSQLAPRNLNMYKEPGFFDAYTNPGPDDR